MKKFKNLSTITRTLVLFAVETAVWVIAGFISNVIMFKANGFNMDFAYFFKESWFVIKLVLLADVAYFVFNKIGDNINK